MKIDLHIHTKATSKSEKGRDIISFEDFKNQLRNSNVGLAAITNHNVFDEDQFKNLEDKENYLLLPGIEVDFCGKNGKREQMNIIFSNEKISDANDLNNFLEKNQTKYDNPIELNSLLNELEGKKAILYLDHKNCETRVSKENEEIIRNKSKKKEWVVILDSSIRLSRILMASSDLNSLIGSDNKDWENDQYEKKHSLKLISTEYKIENFDKFINLIKIGIPISEWSKKLKTQKYDFQIDKEDVTIEILEEGINVIIGDKATGKTEIINGIKEKIEGKKIFSHFSEDYKKEEYDNLIKNPENIFKENEEIHSEIQEKIKEIVNLEKEKNSCPEDFYKDLLYKNNTKYTIQNLSIPNTHPIKYEYIKKIVQKLSEFKTYIENNQNNLFLKDDDNFKIGNKLNWIKDKLVNLFIDNNLENISLNFSKNLIKKIREIIKLEKGVKSSNFSVGLWNEFDFQQQIQEKINYIKRNFKIKEEKKLFEDEIPTIGKIKHVEKNIKMPLNYENEFIDINKKNKGKHTLNDLRKSLKIFKKYSSKNLEEFKNYWNEEAIQKGFISTKKLIVNQNNEEINLSSGQQSILLLSNALNDKKAEYILLDEPSSRIGSNTIMKYLNKKILQLRKMKKTIILTTHNSNLGINVLPNKYFYRLKDGKQFSTLWSYIYSDWFFNDKGEKVCNFNEAIMDILEGGEETYKIRRKIYDSKINNE